MNPNNFTGRIAVVGAGAVGGFVGGRLTDAGYDVTLVDGWQDHVNAIRREGLLITDPGSARSANVRALHFDEISALEAGSLDLVFICVKLYDTDRASRIVLPYLKPSAWVVTLQNGLVEGLVASHVGWERTLGCIGSGMYVALEGPGRIRRSKMPTKNSACVFYVGEAQGSLSERVHTLVDMLSHVDATKATDNLMGLRWSKLVANTMTSGFSAVCGLGLKQVFGDPLCCRVMTGLAAEAIRVGASLGYATEDIFGLSPQVWLKASDGEMDALENVAGVMRVQHGLLTESAVSGTYQDLGKGKPTEVDFMNGFVAAKAAECGASAPLHAEVAAVLRRIEQGKDTPGSAHLQSLGRLAAPPRETT